jgi:hypothetical protein
MCMPAEFDDAYQEITRSKSHLVTMHYLSLVIQLLSPWNVGKFFFFSCPRFNRFIIQSIKVGEGIVLESLLTRTILFLTLDFFLYCRSSCSSSFMLSVNKRIVHWTIRLHQGQSSSFFSLFFLSLSLYINENLLKFSFSTKK